MRETRASGFPSTYWKEMLTYERGTHMTFLRRALQTCSEKATLVCPSVLDSLLLTVTHPLPSATHLESNSAHALPPGKGGRSIYVHTSKKKVEGGGGWVCMPPSTEATCAHEANPGE